MRVFTDKQGISHEVTFEFDPKDERDVRAQAWLDKGLSQPSTHKESWEAELHHILFGYTIEKQLDSFQQYQVLKDFIRSLLQQQTLQRSQSQEIVNDLMSLYDSFGHPWGDLNTEVKQLITKWKQRLEDK